MKAELEIKNFLKAINEFLTEEQQPCGVQVVEWVGLKKKTRTRTNRCGSTQDEILFLLACVSYWIALNKLTRLILVSTCHNQFIFSLFFVGPFASAR